MSMVGCLINVKYSQPLKFGGDDQRWNVKYTHDQETQRYLATIQSEASGEYLAWDADLVVAMSSSQHLWDLFMKEDQFAFRVPNDDGSTDGYNTLQMADDYSVCLKYQKGNPVDSQLWKLVDE